MRSTTRSVAETIFFAKTTRTISTLRRMREESGFHFPILLKTVVMQHNLQHICRIADFAAEHRLEVLYQPIEQNYNTKEDARWFEHSDNWPTDPTLAVETVTKLIDLKRKGRPIMNTVEQLQVMIDYFQTPADLRVAVQNHVAQE